MKNQFFVWALVILFLLGCKATKDNHAYTRVISDPALAERTFRALEVTHPCKTTIVTGKETIIQDTITDITSLNEANKIIDSLLNRILNPHTDTAYLDLDSMRNRLYAEIRKGIKPVTIHVYHTRTDTIQDTRKVELLTADLNRIQGQNIEINKQIVAIKKSNRFRLLTIIGMGLLILVSIVLYIKKK